jgi:hypothetical protein
MHTSSVDPYRPNPCRKWALFREERGDQNVGSADSSSRRRNDSIYWETLSQHESENLRTWLGMTWAEDCEAKPKLPCIDSTSARLPWKLVHLNTRDDCIFCFSVMLRPTEIVSRQDPRAGVVESLR